MKSRQKCILSDVFGIMFVPDHAASEVKDRLMIVFDQFLKLIRVPCQKPGDDLVFTCQNSAFTTAFYVA